MMPPPSKKKCAVTETSKPGTSKSVPRPPTPPRSVTFMKLLQGRELGTVKNFQKTTFELKIKDYKRVRSHQFGNQSEVLHTAYFLRAGKNALIGAWYVQLKNMFTTVIGQLHYDLSKVVVGKTSYIVSRNTIVDACQLTADPDCFLSVTSHGNKHTGEIQVATAGPRGSHEYTIYRYKHPYRRPFWCCNSNAFTEKFAVGCDREICVFSVTGIQEIRSMSDNIYSLTYNNNGSVLHMGTEKGAFLTYDLRTCETVSRVGLDVSLVDDALLLSDENYCLASGVTGLLKKVDLRNQKVVVDYPSHNRRRRRIPVSVNERFGLVSCTGADDLTRIWCLNSGKLLHTFEAPSTYPARSCLVPDSPRGNLHLIQDHFIHVYCMLQ